MPFDWKFPSFRRQTGCFVDYDSLNLMPLYGVPRYTPKCASSQAPQPQEYKLRRRLFLPKPIVRKDKKSVKLTLPIPSSRRHCSIVDANVVDQAGEESSGSVIFPNTDV